MNDDTTFSRIEDSDITDSTSVTTFTQIASCAVGDGYVERRRQSLRAKLEREQYEREEELHNTFSSTFRNLFKAS